MVPQIVKEIPVVAQSDKAQMVVEQQRIKMFTMTDPLAAAVHKVQAVIHMELQLLLDLVEMVKTKQSTMEVAAVEVAAVTTAAVEVVALGSQAAVADLPILIAIALHP